MEVNAFFYKLMNRRETSPISYLVSAYSIPSIHNTDMSGIIHLYCLVVAFPEACKYVNESIKE